VIEGAMSGLPMHPTINCLSVRFWAVDCTLEIKKAANRQFVAKKNWIAQSVDTIGRVLTILWAV
jgi:hypothetical protein